MTPYTRRRSKNVVILSLSVAATIIGLGWLALILGALLWQGLLGLSPTVFTEMTPPPGAAGGLLNPIIGSLIITALAVAIGTPLGILAGTYMAEYGRHTYLTQVVRFINDILLSAPSIVVGLFVYEIMVAPMGHFSGLARTILFDRFTHAAEPKADLRARAGFNGKRIMRRGFRPNALGVYRVLVAVDDEIVDAILHEWVAVR